jgi:para-aminobenzoate synthetase component 1
MNNIKFRPIAEELKDPPPSIDLFAALRNLPYHFFLDSAAAANGLGRFSIMGGDPFLVLKSKGPDLVREYGNGRTGRSSGNPFDAIKEILEKHAARNPAPELPFFSGGAGYFAYDLKCFIEKLPEEAPDDIRLPDSVFGFYDSAVVYDHLKERAYLTALSPEALAKLKKNISSVKAPRPGPACTGRGHPGELRSNFTKSSYMAAVNKAKDYIRKGDIYQVNLSQRFEARACMDPFVLYKRLRDLSPAPFAAYFDFGDGAVASSSPERFLLKHGDYVETRPIKGTRPRGTDAWQDAALEKELLMSAKDHAEHVMIVDLERNDLGRVSRYGSVRPSEFAVLERYSTVFHLVSTVSGRLRRGMGPIECLKAAFPGGSITGAPKIRSMEIIDELEPARRGIYTGAIGYISFDGKMDTSIVIRTFVIKGDKVYFQVGGGIVADSDPEKEYEETLDKARAMMEALGVKRDCPIAAISH